MRYLGQFMLMGSLLQMAAVAGQAEHPRVGRIESGMSAASSGAPSLRGSASGSLTTEAKRALLSVRGGAPLQFEANRGQFDPQVKFASRGLEHTLFLAPSEAVLVLPGHDQVSGNPLRSARRQQAGRRTAPAVARMRLVGSHPSPMLTGLDELPGRSNYLHGSDPKAWRTNIPHYARVHYREVYAGVDLIYYGNEGTLEYDFIVAPGADPSAITLQIDGTTTAATQTPSGAEFGLRIDEMGDLAFSSPTNSVRFHRPRVYQDVEGKKQEIAAQYTLLPDRQVKFKLGAYDPTLPLVIDPVLSFSTYLGGSGYDSGRAVAVDSSGIYVAGRTLSGDFPTFPDPGAVQPLPGSGSTNCVSSVDPNPCFDAFVTKLSLDGTTLIYSTYLGGSTTDAASGIGVDGSGNAYVTGYTISPDFPGMTASSFQRIRDPGSCSICADAFVTKIDSTGSSLLYSSYLGGMRNDYAIAIAVNSSGNAYITGFTDSTDLPGASGSLSVGTCLDILNNPVPCGDALVAKFNPAASGAASLIYSRYLGGSGDDFGNGIVADSLENAYIAGLSVPNTSGGNTFPVTGGFPYGGGSSDGFIAKVDSTGSAVVYSSFLGGRGEDSAPAIALDSSNNAYVAGWTTSDNFRTTVGAFDRTFSVGICSDNLGNPIPCRDAFVSRIDTSMSGASSLTFSSYLGGTSDDHATAVATDTAGNVYVTGGTASKPTDTVPFPVSSTALQSNNAGGYDAFVSSLNSTGSALTFSTYWGGTGSFDAGYGIAVDSSGTIYVAGEADSSDYPITLGAVQTSPHGSGDAVVFRIDPAPAVSLAPTALSFGNQLVGTTSAAKTVTLTNSGNATLNIGSVSVSADYALSSDTCSSASIAPFDTCAMEVTFTPSATGSRPGTLTIPNNAPGNPHTAPLSGTGTVDFGLTVGTDSRTVDAGASAPYDLTLTALGGFNQSVSFTCSVSPVRTLGPTCSFSPASVTPPGTTTLTARTTGPASASIYYGPGAPPSGSTTRKPVMWLWLLLALLPLTASLATRRRRAPVVIMGVMMVVLVWVACGGGGGTSPPPPTRTPAGTYTINVTATSGSLSHQTSVSLTVR